MLDGFFSKRCGAVRRSAAGLAGVLAALILLVTALPMESAHATTWTGSISLTSTALSYNTDDPVPTVTALASPGLPPSGYVGGLLATATPSLGAPGTASTYAYDTNARLASVAGPSSPNKWTYDAADRLTKNPTGTTFAYDDANQLSTATPTSGSATSYGYNNRGQRTSATVGTAAPVTYDYDQAGHFSKLTSSTGSTWAYTYDGDGTRASVKVGTAAATQFTVDPTSSLVLNDGTSQFIYGPAGMPIEQVRGTTATYLHGDQLDSTVLITTQAGATADTYTYDPYGKVTAHTGTTTTQLQFNGQYVDVGTGLVYLRARMYDTSTGQFTTRDPLESTTRQAYGYGAQEPLVNTDPSGLIDLGSIARDAAQATAYAAVNFGRGVSGGLTDKIADAFSPGASCTVPSTGLAARTAQGAGVLAGFIVAAPGAGARVAAEDASGFVGRKGVTKVFDDGSLASYGGEINIPRGTNASGAVGGRPYSGHAFDQMQGRGITPSVVDDAINDRVMVSGADGSSIFYSSANNISVVVSSDGRVITVGYGQFKPR